MAFHNWRKSGNYYISKAANAHDSNAGTQDAPFRNVSKCVANVDNIIGTGIYTGSITTLGTLGRLIGDGMVVIDGGNVAGSYGQPALVRPLESNILAMAASRYGVTFAVNGGAPVVKDNFGFTGNYDGNPFNIPAAGVGVVNIDFTAKGQPRVVYVAGFVVLHFYHVYTPAVAPSGRIKCFNAPTGGMEQWITLINWKNVSTSYGHVWIGQVPGAGVHASDLELTITAPSTEATKVSCIEYLPSFPDMADLPTVNRHNEISLLYGKLRFRNNSNTQTIELDNQSGKVTAVGGIVLKAPNGSRAVITLNNDLTLKITAV